MLRANPVPSWYRAGTEYDQGPWWGQAQGLGRRSGGLGRPESRERLGSGQ